jgi:pilus assembly protein CpaC
MVYQNERGGLPGPHAKKGPRNQSLSWCSSAVRWTLALTAIVLTTATVIWAQVPSGPGSDPKKTAFDANGSAVAELPPPPPAGEPHAQPNVAEIAPPPTPVAHHQAAAPDKVPQPAEPAPAGGALQPMPPAGGAPRPGDAVPMPRILPGSHPRLEVLPVGVKPPVGTTPEATPQVREKFKKYVGNFIDPEDTIEMVIGRPRLWYLKEAPFRIQVADERIMSYTIIGNRPTELSLLGQYVGSTVLNLWFGDRDDINKQTVLSFLVHVLPDPEAKERLERIYKALEDELNRAFPDAYICLFLVGDKLVVSGQAKDAIEAVKILQILRANAPTQGVSNTGQPAAQNIPVSQVNLNLNGPYPDISGQPRQALENYLLQGETNIINMMRIPGEQQVMLKVTVAEVNRAAARQIGLLNASVANNSGVVFTENTQFAAQGTTAAAGNISAVLDNGKVNLGIAALRNVNLARSLAEPNLVTLNGQPAFFQAGGEFPVPVVTGATAVGLEGVSFVPFGVTLNFIPYITDKDRIRLQLTATVSTKDLASSASIAGTNVPGLNVRTVSTVVEMREGQTLAVGGLLQTNLSGQTTRIPLFGDIPFGGQLFRTDQTAASEQELVLLVSPELVHPMEPREIPPLPGSDYFEPGDLEFYLHGRLESRRSYDYRSPVMDDIHRMAAYRHCELLYFVGPHGHCDDR